eukprot:6205380-Pleurochrysis_carterae.AAC.7
MANVNAYKNGNALAMLMIDIAPCCNAFKEKTDARAGTDSGHLILKFRCANVTNMYVQSESLAFLGPFENAGGFW